MLKFKIILYIFCLALAGKTYAQDTLPKISVINRYGKIIISWKNAYGASIANINIQRSTDSIKRFTTIGTVLNPMNIENGYVDPKFPGGKIYYRLFVAFEGGDYVFTKSYRPVLDTTKEINPIITTDIKIETLDDRKTGDKKDLVTRPVKPPVFVPSKFVFTGKDNNVIINLPDAPNQKFSIRFFDEYNNPVFELKTIREAYLILEKVNFLHAGWFKYDLFNNDILLERFKFYIPKDGKITNSRDQRNK
jgi:hypothetical protein